ncbi:LCI fold-containing protein [Photorhabdus laumondii]|uniref:LCI fold domain-containing protein n=1 Tax=Photorhabdus laumondii subsp. clarkei TaxID=2029685 RepID=A0A329VJ91_9GAMM|nr:LCI fold-containing protein [Photorhabdus laumondii]RAW91895.1 hypothetical protein CKY01_06890 [Photorhabdus laumondii subsp. clarkei]
MFKKLLTVGALATALIGGIGTASAGVPFEYYSCTSSGPYTSSDRYGNFYTRYNVQPSNYFANEYIDGGIKWYFKGSKKLGPECNGKYVALYEGRDI